MAQLIASRDMVVNGHKIKADHPIPVEALRRMPPGRIKQLTDQRMVHEDSTRVSGKKGG
jgi:hypothetical protein